MGLKFFPGDLVTVGKARDSLGYEYEPASIDVYKRAGALRVDKFLVCSLAPLGHFNSWETALVIEMVDIDHYNPKEEKISAVRILLPSGGTGWVRASSLKGVR